MPTNNLAFAAISSKQLIRILAQSKSKQATNENIQKQLETLENKFQELWEDYGIDI
jgi:hypothetical protein